jgi:RNA polymerase sigma-70 factor, ECF subfamily
MPWAIDRPAPPEVDAKTIHACRRHERDALDQVLRAHLPGLERLLGRILGHPADVADVLQDTLEAAIRGFTGYSGKAPVGSWLATIAVRSAYRHLRRPERRRRAALELVAAEAESAQPSDSIEGEVSGGRALERVYRHLASVSPKNRIAFVLHVVDGHSIEEVAALMGATRAATKSRIFLARRRLVRCAKRDPLLRELLPGGKRP